MSTIDLPKVRDAPDQSHQVFDWTVRDEIGGEPLAIRGHLDHEPPPESRFEPILSLPLAALAVAEAIWRPRRPRPSRA